MRGSRAKQLRRMYALTFLPWFHRGDRPPVSWKQFKRAWKFSQRKRAA